MIKVLHSILIILIAFMSMITKSISSDISTILRNQQLTVFSNLIDNSIKYSQDGKNIYVKSQISEGKLIDKNIAIIIKDEGVGIPQQLIPRITERFFRVDTEKSKKVGGTGLGLAIMKHIISQHRGDYEILSKVNEGTEIKIYLPTK